MAIDTKAPAKGSAPEVAKPKKSKKKLIIIVLVLLLGLGYGGYTMFAPKKVEPISAGDTVPVDPITVNLADSHYLKIAIAVVLVKGKLAMADFIPSKADNAVIDEYSNLTVDAVSGSAARTALLADLTSKVQKAYPGEVYAIYLTQFVTQ